MTDKDIQDALNRFKDLQEAPRLRAFVAEQQEMLAEKDRQIEKMEQAHDEEVASLHYTIFQLQHKLDSEMEKNKELESTLIQVGKKKFSLKEFDRLVKKKVKAEMDDQIQARSIELAMSKAPLFAQADVNKYPDHCSQETKRTIDAQIAKGMDEILYDEFNWPQQFREYFSSVVRVEAERLKDSDYHNDLERDVEMKLEAMRNGAWREYIENFWWNTLTPFLRNSFRNQIISLQEVFEISCPKCGNMNQFRLTPDTLAKLIVGRTIKIPCSHCSGVFRQTMFQVSLGQILWAIIDGHESIVQEPRAVDGMIIYKARKIEEPEDEEEHK
ncbi:hypothetical protein ACFL0D_04010 [Thermoproteota archaeon]